MADGPAIRAPARLLCAPRRHAFKSFFAGWRHGTEPLAPDLRLQLHGDCLDFGILLQPVFPEFPADAGLLESPERRGGVENVIAVHPDGARANRVGDRVRLADIPRPYTS